MVRLTTIVAVKHKGKTAIAGDGQVTFGENTIIKVNARGDRTAKRVAYRPGFTIN